MGATQPDQQTTERSLCFCREFLGRTWAKIHPEQFKIEKISGGLSNLMYLCSVVDDVITEKNEPRKVIVRIYGQIVQENPETVVMNSVVFALLAEKTMGPQLYGLFTGGRVEEYIPSRIVTSTELANPLISRQCAQIMARFHKLDMPLCKEPKWLFVIMTRFLDEALNNVTFNQDDTKQRLLMTKLHSYKLAPELQCLKQMLLQVNSPVVFCHNDMQGGNILYCEKADTFNLIPIDFEYASYNYRGFDIANHLCECCYDYTNPEFPFFSADLKKFPSRESQVNFLTAYLHEMGIHGAPCEVEINKLLQEIAVFALASHFMWGLWSMVQSQMSSINFGYLEYAVARIEAYFEMKKAIPDFLNNTL